MVFILSFLPCVSSHQCNDLCETVLVKRKTHLTKVWHEFSLPKCYIFTQWLAFWWFCINSFVILKTPQKVEGSGSRALPSSSRPAHAPRTLQPSVLKKGAPCQRFLLYILIIPQGVHIWHCPLNLHVYFLNAHFDMLQNLNNVACMVAIWFFVCVRKHESNLPTNILTRVGKEMWCLR